MNDHAVLQAQASQQDYSGNPKGVNVQIGLSERGKVLDSERNNLSKNDKQVNWC